MQQLQVYHRLYGDTILLAGPKQQIKQVLRQTQVWMFNSNMSIKKKSAFINFGKEQTGNTEMDGDPIVEHCQYLGMKMGQPIAPRPHGVSQQEDQVHDPQAWGVQAQPQAQPQPVLGLHRVAVPDGYTLLQYSKLRERQAYITSMRISFFCNLP